MGFAKQGFATVPKIFNDNMAAFATVLPVVLIILGTY